MGGAYSPDQIESVRNAGDIVQIISDYVPLRPSGARLKGLCPFHEEKTPSFSVDPGRQLFYCFGCQTGGDIFKFLQLYEGVGFGESVEILARRSGVALTPSGPSRPRGPVDRTQKILAAADRFFRAQLAGPAGAPALTYLKNRGIGPETIEQLGLGSVPDGWNNLGQELARAGFRGPDIVTAGLALPRKQGPGEYDRFRERVIFPIRDVQGGTVAFGGRAYGDGEPKYINSPETPVYTKGEHLYGLDLARDTIRRQGAAIVVEGYMDVAALRQAGFPNVVASLGTAFTPQQARLLARYTEKVIFSYDGDAAGAKAMTRSLDLLLKRGFEVRIVMLPDGVDPDDFIRREGADAYRERVDAAPHYLEFLIDRSRRADSKQKAVNAVLPHLAKLENSIDRATWAGRLADRLGIDDDLVLQELRDAVREARPRLRERPQGNEAVLPPAEARLVYQLLRSEEEREVCSEIQWDDLAHTQVLRIVAKIVELDKNDSPVDYAGVLAELEDEDDRKLLTQIAFRDEPDQGPTAADCLWAFRRKRLQKEGKRVRRNIGQLDHSGSAPTDIDRELAKLQELARLRDSL